MGRKDRGFSLIELTVVLGIIGIMAVLGVRAMSTVFARNRFDEVVRGTADVFLRARFNALRTGKRTAVSIENRQIIAFTDINNNKMYDAGEPIVARYPSANGSQLPNGIEVVCPTLRERGRGPLTAFFDARGFYVDVHDGVARHNADLCVSEASSQRDRTITISLFGNIAPGENSCGEFFVCPDVAPD